MTALTVMRERGVSGERAILRQYCRSNKLGVREKCAIACGNFGSETALKTEKFFAPAAGLCLRRRLRRALQFSVYTVTGGP